MQAVFPGGSGRVNLREVPTPKIKPGEVLVKMRACGICGTDLEKIRGEAHTPQVLGHEVSGDISEAGEGVQKIQDGERVVVHHHVSCGECYYCRRGDSTLCELYQKTNLDPCGFAEYFRVPRENVARGAVLRVPDGVSYDEASFVEPLGCCLRSLARLGKVADRSAAVLGVGSTGVLMVQLLRSNNVKLLVASDVSPARLKFCKLLGVDVTINPASENIAAAVENATEGRGVDLVVVATGNLRAMEDALAIVRRGGTVNLFGMPPKDANLSIDPSRLFIREVKIIPNYSTTEKEMSEAMELIASHTVKVGELVSHRFDLAQAEEAFRLAADTEKSVKVIVAG